MYCEHCKIYVETPTLECPLCKTNLKESDTLVNVSYPSIKKISNIRKLIKRIISTVLLSAMIICTMINFVLFNGNYWSTIVDAGCIACLIMLQYAIRKWIRINKTIFAGSFCLVALLIVIDMFATTSSIKVATWSLNYTMPLIFLGALAASTVFLFFGKVYFSEFCFTSLMLSIVNILLLIRLPYTIIKWPLILSGSLGVIVIMLHLIIFKEKFLEQLKRKFHA